MLLSSIICNSCSITVKHCVYLRYFNKFGRERSEWVVPYHMKLCCLKEDFYVFDFVRPHNASHVISYSSASPGRSEHLVLAEWYGVCIP